MPKIVSTTLWQAEGLALRARLNLEQLGLMLAIRLEAVERGGHLPADDEAVAAALKVNLRTWRRVSAELTALGLLFRLDGELHSADADDAIALANRRYREAQQGGFQSGATRRSKHKDSPPEGGNPDDELSDYNELHRTPFGYPGSDRPLPSQSSGGRLPTGRRAFPQRSETAKNAPKTGEKQPKNRRGFSGAAQKGGGNVGISNGYDEGGSAKNRTTLDPVLQDIESTERRQSPTMPRESQQMTPQLVALAHQIDDETLMLLVRDGAAMGQSERHTTKMVGSWVQNVGPAQVNRIVLSPGFLSAQNKFGYAVRAVGNIMTERFEVEERVKALPPEPESEGDPTIEAYRRSMARRHNGGASQHGEPRRMLKSHHPVPAGVESEDEPEG